MADPAINPADLQLYESIKPDLLNQGMEGKFALIAGGELVEVYDSYQAAYDAAVASYRPPFLIKEVLKQERVETI